MLFLPAIPLSGAAYDTPTAPEECLLCPHAGALLSVASGGAKTLEVRGVAVTLQMGAFAKHWRVLLCVCHTAVPTHVITLLPFVCALGWPNQHHTSASPACQLALLRSMLLR